MKRINNLAMLDSLKADVKTILHKARQLEAEHDILALQPATGGWTIAQVLEHLNIYSKFYHTAIEEKLHLHTTRAIKDYKPGWMGNYFTKLMKPVSNHVVGKKMKAPKDAVPSQQPDGKLMLQEFIRHQHQLLNLLQIAETADLGGIRIPTFLSKFINLKLGDSFRFLVAHEQRHFVQISNIREQLGKAPGVIIKTTSPGIPPVV